MNNMTIALATGAAVLTTTAQAQPGPGVRGDPWGDATVQRADEERLAGERFDGLDTDKDGAIGDHEMKAAQGQRGAGGGLRRADEDGDGKVTKAEYLAAQLRRFDRQDGNGDGQLTKAERETARAERMRGGWGGPSFGGE